MLHRIPTAVVAALALVVGFGTAELTGLRWIGGVVVVVGAAWCLVRSWRTTTWWRLVAVVLLGAACFVGSHVLAGTLGPWGSVALVSAVLALGVVLLVDDRTGLGGPAGQAGRSGRAAR